MSQPYVGEIRIFAGNFPPNGWMFCDGQLLPISENDVLFQLIGTTYGGDGQETFCLPDLRGRVPVHMGTSSADGQTYQIGEMAGVETVTLTTQQIPTHTHSLLASPTAGTRDTASGGVFAAPSEVRPYAEGTVPHATKKLAPTALAWAGGSQPHENMQPYLAVHFIISLFGVFPSQS